MLIALTGVDAPADVRMKAMDNCFVGFPAAWQTDAGARPPVFKAAGLDDACHHRHPWPRRSSVPGLKFIHPVRTLRWRLVNLPVLWRSGACSRSGRDRLQIRRLVQVGLPGGGNLGCCSSGW